MAACTCLLVTIMYVVLVTSLEVIKDPGFEGNSVAKFWHCEHCTLQFVSNGHLGTHGMTITNRSDVTSGPRQEISLQPGGRYSFTAVLNQLNTVHDQLYQLYSVAVLYTWADNNFSRSILSLHGPDPDIVFIADDLSIQTVAEEVNWEARANARINKIRKNNMHVIIEQENALSKSDIALKIDHRRHLFGFGSVVNIYKILERGMYSRVVHDMFNCATMMGWDWLHNSHLTFAEVLNMYHWAVRAAKDFKQHGIRVRGESALGSLPHFMENMTESELLRAIEDRVEHLTNVSHGIVDQWDVSSHLLEGHLYEQLTGDANYTQHIFDMVHKADPKTQLFLNEGDVVAVGAATEAFIDEAKEFKASNAGLYGLGVMSQFQDFVSPDPTLMKTNLDKLATTGLPMWVTRLGVGYTDDQVAADWYERALRMYFSHPSVEGVTLDGFWNHDTDTPLHALFRDYDFKMTPVGQRYLDLIKTEWSTHVTHNVSRGSSFTVHGFHGYYDISIYYKGRPIMYESVTLHGSDIIIKIRINANGGGVVLPSSSLTFVNTSHEVPILHRYVHTIGKAVSGSQDEDLKCVSRVSRKGNRNEAVYASCTTDEVLTGCSSYIHLENFNGWNVSLHEWARGGEKLVLHNGLMSCMTYNKWNSDANVTSPTIQTEARCCTTRNLNCTYMTSGRTATVAGSATEADCPSGFLATGCMAWCLFNDLLGAFPDRHLKGCIAQSETAREGVYSYASCCNAPSLVCKTTVGRPSSLLPGTTSSVSCEPGYVITGCNVRSEFGHAAGAYITDKQNISESCVAVNGVKRLRGQEGVVAYATCCKVYKHGVPIIG